MLAHEFSVADDHAAIFLVIWGRRGVGEDVADFPLGFQEGADRLAGADGVHFAFVQRETKIAGGEDAPGDVLGGVDSVVRQHARREDERRCAQAWDADTLALQVGNAVDAAADARLHPQTATMNAGCDLQIRALLDGFQ
jgi:hypothetical protein